MKTTTIDLFNHWELIPQNVVDILETCYDGINESVGYKDLEELQKKLNEIGYNFNYDLDAQPYCLHQMKFCKP